MSILMPPSSQKAPQSKTKRLNNEKNKLTEILWRYQETQMNGPIEEPELHYLTGWGHSKFKQVLNSLLKDPDSGVIRTPSGRIGYEW